MGQATSGLLSVAIVALAFAACAPPSQPRGAAGSSAAAAAEVPPSIQPTTLKVAYVPVLAFGPLYRAISKGYLSAAGIDAELTVVQSASDAVAFLGTGQMDVALGNVGAPFFNAVNRGLEVKIVAGNSYNKPGASTLAAAPLLVRRQLADDGTVRSPADLKGRKVAINVLGGIQEYTLAQVLGRHQLSVSDVDVQTIAFPDMLATLASGAVDAALVPEPFSGASRDQGVAAVLEANPAPGAVVTAVLFGVNLLKPDQEPVARAFLGALRKAANELQTEQEIFSPENLSIWSEYTRVPEAAIQKGAPSAYAPNLTLDVKSVLDQQGFLLRLGRLEFREALPEGRIVESRFEARS